MTGKVIIKLLIISTLLSCGSKDKSLIVKPAEKAKVSRGGLIITFPADTATTNFFKTEKIDISNLKAEYSAPAKVAATIVKSEENTSTNLVLFDNPDLTANYTSFIQHRININQIQNVNIRQKTIELERFKDLAANGAATQRDVLDAQTALSMENTNLQNEKAAITEHEAKLKLSGFNPEALINAKTGYVWLICDVPESQINKLKLGNSCFVRFASFPDETFTGKIEAFGDVVDNLTRMIKMRISLYNDDGRMKAGMFAVVSFGVSEGDLLSVPGSAIVTVQGKNYVFIRNSDTEFERREVMSGQQINDRIIIYSGLKTGDKVVTHGAMQLKGLSFGF
jgi:multidrug efflux pump subunit AcrA (membrane-fusion protein)